MRVRLPVVVAAAALLLVAGCSGDPYQTRVRSVDPAAESSSTITPIERGKIRREALAQVKKGIDAWLADDIEAMKAYFSEDQVAYYEKVRRESATKHRYWVRKHGDQKMDVVEMNADGTEVSITYAFVNDSYWADARGRMLERPTHKRSQIQIGAKKVDGRWIIVRMIGVPETIR